MIETSMIIFTLFYHISWENNRAKGWLYLESSFFKKESSLKNSLTNLSSFLWQTELAHTASATVFLKIDSTSATDKCSAAQTFIDEKRLRVGQGWSVAQAINLLEQFFKISIPMAVTFTLIIEVLVSQLMANNLSEGLQPKSFIDFWVEI